MATPTPPTVTSVMNRVCSALNREHDVNPRSHKSRALWKLHRMLYPTFVLEHEAEQRAALSPATPPPSEPGTTPEELATIVAEETARAEMDSLAEELRWQQGG